jgi:hypothetical protein
VLQSDGYLYYRRAGIDPQSHQRILHALQIADADLNSSSITHVGDELTAMNAQPQADILASLLLIWSEPRTRKISTDACKGIISKCRRTRWWWIRSKGDCLTGHGAAGQQGQTMTSTREFDHRDQLCCTSSLRHVLTRKTWRSRATPVPRGPYGSLLPFIGLSLVPHVGISATTNRNPFSLRVTHLVGKLNI